VTRLRIAALRLRHMRRPHRRPKHRPHLWANRPHCARFVSLLGVAVDASASTADGLRMALALAGPQTDEGAVHSGIRRWLRSVHSL
jgi:hypothetical protein